MKHWIQAARLRTLPLSLSGIILGSFYAFSQGFYNWKILLFAFTTTLGFQVLSNFANDYGDGVKGTDNEDRIGPKRALQSGVITPLAMKKGIIITVIFSLLSAMLLIYFAFGNENFGYSLLFFALGILSIIAAIKYTVGSNAYGYSGFGDVFVFLFFGLVSTLGVYFLYAKQMDFILILPATAIGFLSVGVLNLNNMRDEKSDRKAGKNTIVVKIGWIFAKMYQYFLISSAMGLIVIFAILKNFTAIQYLFLIAFIPLIIHLQTVFTTIYPENLDPELKKVALSTFLLSFLLSVCFFL
jgi:1,4-dihydroxy-2-naphthoate octaprenyltransferase